MACVIMRYLMANLAHIRLRGVPDFVSYAFVGKTCGEEESSRLERFFKTTLLINIFLVRIKHFHLQSFHSGRKRTNNILLFNTWMCPSIGKQTHCSILSSRRIFAATKPHFFMRSIAVLKTSEVDPHIPPRNNTA